MTVRRPTQYWPCRKHPHKSRGAAEAQIRSLRALNCDDKDLADLCAYLCRCGAWHVGHRLAGRLEQAT